MGAQLHRGKKGKTNKGGIEFCTFIALFVLLMGFWSTLNTRIDVIAYWLSRDSYEVKQVVEPRITERSHRRGTRTVVEGRINHKNVWLRDPTITSRGNLEGDVLVLYPAKKAYFSNYSGQVLPLRFARRVELARAIAHILTVLMLLGAVWFLAARLVKRPFIL